MIGDFIKATSRHLLETKSPVQLAKRVAEDTGMETETVRDIFENPEEAEAFLGRRYLKLSSHLADNLEDAIQSGELTPSDIVRAIPVVSKTARLYLGESTVTLDSPTQALLEALEESEDKNGNTTTSNN